MTRTLACGPVRIRLETDEDDAGEWLAEFLAPWFVASEGGDFTVTLEARAEAHAAFARGRPAETSPRRCFRLDREIVSLSTWPHPEGLAIGDDERSCFLVISPSGVAIIADPSTRRWRFTLQWIFHEVAATELRRAALDLHAAAIEHDGRAVAWIGPKRAGKTTLALHCLRSGRCRWIANDRALAARAGDSFTIRGMPSVVKIQPATLAAFPELAHDLRALERPYLHSLREVARRSITPGRVPAELALSPAQLAHQLGIDRLAEAPIGALAFPEVRADHAGVAVEPLSAAEAAARIRQNVYAVAAADAGATLFDDLTGGESVADEASVEALATAAPSHRVILGRDAYARPDFAARLLGELLA